MGVEPTALWEGLFSSPARPIGSAGHRILSSRWLLSARCYNHLGITVSLSGHHGDTRRATRPLYLGIQESG